MGIGSITSANSMSVMQMTSSDLKDHKSKSIQNEITDVQQQIQKLSSEDELSANEKENERKKLQKEKSSLDTELKQHQEELVRSQKRERMLAELREAQNPEKEEPDEDKVQTADTSTDAVAQEKASADGRQAQSLQPGTVISQNSDGTVILKEVMKSAENNEETAQTEQTDEAKAETVSEEEANSADTDTDPAAEFRPTTQEMQAMVSSDASMQLADRMGTLVAKTNDGIAVLKGEIKLDEYRGTDTERKETQLEEMQKQSRQETSFQFNMLGEAMDAMKTAADTGLADKAAQTDQEKHFQVSGLSTAPDEQAVQQGFHVAIA